MIDTLTRRVPLGPLAREVTVPVITGNSSSTRSAMLFDWRECGKCGTLTKFTGAKTVLDASLSFTVFGAERVLRDWCYRRSKKKKKIRIRQRLWNSFFLNTV